MNAPYLVYIGDPMCSWCWGFAPVLEQLQHTHSDLNLRIIIGGLRPGDAAQPLDTKLRSYLLNHWQQVEAASGQAFNHATLNREGWLYDSELPARAVVTMRQLDPAQAFAFFKDLQAAFYTDALDVTNSKVYGDLLESYSVNPDGFVKHMLSEEIKEATYQDFALTQQLGIRGFPSLLLGRGKDLTLLASGYQPFERLDAVLKSQLSPLPLS